MQYKDLGVVLRQCFKNDIPLFANELLTLAIQVAEGIEYLTTVRSSQEQCDMLVILDF